MRTVLENAVRLKTYDYEGPDGLLSLDMAGDWVVRPAPTPRPNWTPWRGW